MSSVLFALDIALGVLRQALLVVAIVVAALALVDWLTRTRRIGPFTPIARFSRRWLTPIFTPMERTVVRAGGRPSTAPWWTVVAVIVLGLLLIALADFVRAIVLQVEMGITTPGAIPGILIDWTFGFLQLALLIRVLSSWFAGLRYSRWVAWTYPVTEWLLAPLRRIIPNVGMLDITPIIAYFVLGLLHDLVLKGLGG